MEKTLHIRDILKGFPLETDQPLDRYTSFRIGGPADFLARPRTLEDLVSLIRAAQTAKLPVTVLGGGTNTLVSDAGIRGLVVVLTDLKSGPGILSPKGVDPASGQAGQSDPKTVLVRAMAGERLSTLCRFATDQGLSGLEWAAGIPGTLGGAVVMNAGGFGSDMKAVVVSLDILDISSLAVKTISAENLDFSYRRLSLSNAIVVGALIRLAPGDPQAIKQKAAKNLAAKKASQPVSKASGGCFFKNPSPDRPAGWLIEQAGLKGYKHKGAMVSDRHANFIVNLGHAQYKDIQALRTLVQDRVYKKFGIQLESEVKTIGD